MPKKAVKQDDPEQSKRFIEDATRLGCDQTESEFEKSLLKTAKHKPKPKKP